MTPLNYPLTQLELAAFMVRKLVHGHDVDLSTARSTHLTTVGRSVEARCKRCHIWVMAEGGGAFCGID